jgi:hypothetical protein
MRADYEDLIGRLLEARERLAEEDSVFAQTYIPEQATRSALRIGINALAEAVNAITILVNSKTGE